MDSSLHPAGIYLLKVNNRNTRPRREIHSKLTTDILHLALLFLLDSIHCNKYLTLKMKLRKVSRLNIGMNLSLGQFSSHFPTLQLSQEQLKVDEEKALDSLFSML